MRKMLQLVQIVRYMKVVKLVRVGFSSTIFTKIITRLSFSPPLLRDANKPGTAVDTNLPAIRIRSMTYISGITL